jgi:predicted nucleic-acid-binding protein
MIGYKNICLQFKNGKAMKSKFKGYYKPQPSEFEKLWEESIFVFDTNVMFDFYRYSEDTVNVLFTIFEKLKGKNKIWIPHWVGLEYHRGLEERIKEQVEKYTSTIKDLENFSKKIKTQREHPFLSKELQKKARLFYEEFNKELNTQKRKLKDLIIENPVKEKIAQLIGENIGDSLSEEEEVDIIKEGDIRLPKNIPPGYVDYKEKLKRPGLDKYGDFIIWKQILKYSKENKKHIIFVTFDTKEDWYKLIAFNNSKVLFGPRPELIEEFNKISGCDIWFYSTPDFIVSAIINLKIDIERSKLEKVKEETTKSTLSEIDDDCISEVQNESESIDLREQNLIGGTTLNESESTESSGSI